MDVAVTELRAQLRSWLDRARQGEEIIITEHGIPVVRLTAVESTPKLDQLRRDGVIGRSGVASRPAAGGRSRPRPRHAVADRVSADRR
jgi:prevent-host-death family protein